MTKRHKRHPALTDAQRAALIASAAALHRDLVLLMAALKPHCPDYVAISDLSAALALAVRRATGDDPPWMRERVWL